MRSRFDSPYVRGLRDTRPNLREAMPPMEVAGEVQPGHLRGTDGLNQCRRQKGNFYGRNHQLLLISLPIIYVPIKKILPIYTGVPNMLLSILS